MNGDEEALMRRLGTLVRAPAVQEHLAGVVAGLRQELAGAPAVKSTFALVPLALYDADLGPDIGSSWLFVLRDSHDHPAERHPNSVQRMFAFDQPGAMEVWDGDSWRRCDLIPGTDDLGLSIPAYHWHRPARIDRVWTAISFHSVPPDALIEEVGDPATGETGTSRTYLT